MKFFSIQKRQTPTHPSNLALRLLALFIFLLPLGISTARAADYVFCYTANSKTYFLANEGTNLVRVDEFNPATCIWTTSGTIGNTSRTISKEIDGTTYYLYGTTTDKGALTLYTNSSNFRSDGSGYLGYYSSRYYYVYYNNGWKCSRYSREPSASAAPGSQPDRSPAFRPSFLS